MKKTQTDSQDIANKVIGKCPRDDFDTWDACTKARYDYYINTYGNNNSLNGAVFEWLILDALVSTSLQTLTVEGLVLPIYYHAVFEGVFPHAEYDIVLLKNNRPHVISCKTSPRERWKQAELEAQALKHLYPHACCSLIMMETAKDVNATIIEGALGIDQLIIVGSNTETVNKWNNICTSPISRFSTLDDYLTVLSRTSFSLNEHKSVLSSYESFFPEGNESLETESRIKEAFGKLGYSIDDVNAVANAHKRTGFSKVFAEKGTVNINKLIHKEQSGEITLNELQKVAGELGGKLSYSFIEISKIQNDTIRKELDKGLDED